MLFEDQVEQLKEYYQSVEARVQESSAFNSLRDRYVALSPLMQKLVITSCACLALFFTLAAPIANYKTSVDNMASFEERKSLTEKIISYEKKSSSKSPKPKEYRVDKLNNSVQGLSRSYAINYLPDQTSVFTARSEKKIILGAQQNNFNVKTRNTNISQFTALAYNVQKLNKSLFIDSLELIASRDKPGYFNGSIGVTNLFVKPASEILPKPQVKKPGKRKSRRGRK